MKTKYVVALALGILGLLACITIDSRPMIEKSVSGDGFVVLELFTSEGCSSCPKADELLARLRKEAGNKPVYILAYHIDYWDHQGWRDIFSNADYSKRQYWYADKLNAQVYTPQVIVNGITEVVGSDQAALTSALNSSLTGKTSTLLELNGRIKEGRLSVSYQLTQASPGLHLVIAVVQKNAVRQIKRGENTGRSLNHIQIVQDLHSYKLEKSSNGQVAVLLPNAFSETGWEVICFLQNRETGEIFAAGKVNLNDISAAELSK